LKGVKKFAPNPKNFQSMQKTLKASDSNYDQEKNIQLFIFFVVHQNNKQKQKQ
jgi:hypothetical protein